MKKLTTLLAFVLLSTTTIIATNSASASLGHYMSLEHFAWALPGITFSLEVKEGPTYKQGLYSLNFMKNGTAKMYREGITAHSSMEYGQYEVKKATLVELNDMGIELDSEIQSIEGYIIAGAGRLVNIFVIVNESCLLDIDNIGLSMKHCLSQN